MLSWPASGLNDREERAFPGKERWIAPRLVHAIVSRSHCNLLSLFFSPFLLVPMIRATIGIPLYPNLPVYAIIDPKTM